MEENSVVVTAFVAALVEGVRHLGSRGTHVEPLYLSVAALIDRSGFDMIIAELIEQKTLKYDWKRHLVYCGPSPIERMEQQ